MVAILSPIDDFKVEIDFCGGPEAERLVHLEKQGNKCGAENLWRIILIDLVL